MADVQFEEETTLPQQAAVSAAPKGMYKLVISLGLAKDQKEAQIILVAIAIIALIVAVVVPFVI